LREDNSPNSRAGGKIENVHFIFHFRKFQRIAQQLRAAVTHWNNVLDQLGEKRGSGLFPIARLGRATSANDFVQFQPQRNQSIDIHREKSGERAGLFA